MTADRHIKSMSLSSEFTLQEKVVGTGACGQVHVALRQRDGRKFAVKTYRRAYMSERQLEHLKNEISIHLSLHHPNIVHLENVFEDDEHVHLVLELLTGQDLFEHLQSHGALTDKTAALTIHHVLSALSYLHSDGIVHRDIKLENIMFKDKHCSVAMLLDFGFATVWNGDAMLTCACGTPGYAAPEIYEQSYTNAVDLWALGVMTYEVLLGTCPFQESHSPRHPKIDFGSRFQTVSRNAQDFVRSLLQINPSERLTASEALAHPWFCELTGRRREFPLESRILTHSMTWPSFHHKLHDMALSSEFMSLCHATEDHYCQEAFLPFDNINSSIAPDETASVEAVTDRSDARRTTAAQQRYADRFRLAAAVAFGLAVALALGASVIVAVAVSVAVAVADGVGFGTNAAAKDRTNQEELGGRRKSAWIRVSELLCMLAHLFRRASLCVCLFVCLCHGLGLLAGRFHRVFHVTRTFEPRVGITQSCQANVQ
mmetsp:Transcript_66880/g.116344  ORF Transcript_66880/g.116344 Transcript_66880/m.116344 type:complete len:486 (-) Transcript_66880:272-1729(-)